MQNWQKALKKFISNWENKKFTQGAILTGSYAVGNQTTNSDIDVHIVLNNDVKWRERGNLMIVKIAAIRFTF